MAKLSKGEISTRVASKLSVSQTQGSAALNAVLEAVQEAIKAGNDVTLTGFGSFRTRDVGQRRVRSIRGGNFVTIPAHKRVSFTAGSDLKP